MINHIIYSLRNQQMLGFYCLQDDDNDDDDDEVDFLGYFINDYCT